MRSKTTSLVALIGSICFSLGCITDEISRMENAFKTLMMQFRGDEPSNNILVSSNDTLLHKITRKHSTITNIAASSCEIGTSNRTVDLKSFFPEQTTIPVHSKGLLAMPVGGKNAIYVDQMVLATMQYFDLILFAFDEHDWTGYTWYPEVTVVITPGGRKWKLAKDHLIPAAVNVHYSHMCFWDDDLVPSDLFDAGLFLHILQQQKMTIAQPTIQQHCHPWYAGTCAEHTNYDSHFQSVNLVEIMAPCYSREIWNDYMWPNILENEQGSGWGIDDYLHRNPGVEQVYAIHLPLDHMDTKLLPGKNDATQRTTYFNVTRDLGWHTQQVEDYFASKQWQERDQFEIEHYKMQVTEKCDLHPVQTGSSVSISYFKTDGFFNAPLPPEERRRKKTPQQRAAIRLRKLERRKRQALKELLSEHSAFHFVDTEVTAVIHVADSAE